MPVTIRTLREKEKLLRAAVQRCSGLPTSNTRKKKIYIYVLTNTHTHKISYYPNPCCTSGLWMCFVGYVCACVWALLCLQDAQRRTGSLKSFGYKVKGAGREMKTKRREIEGKERQQDTTTHTKGGQAQQSAANSHFIFVMLTVPSSCPLSEGDKPKGEGEKVFTLTRTFCRTPFCVPPPSPPSRTFFFFF